MTEKSICISFDNNRLLPQLYGEQDVNLAKMEACLGITVSSRGNMVFISGDAHNVRICEAALNSIYNKLEKKGDISNGEVDAVIRMLVDPLVESSTDNKEKKMPEQNNVIIKTLKKHITPFTHKQAKYMHALMSREMTFGVGPAGTGKTYIAVAAAVSMFAEGKVDRIILSRPAVEAGESLGFLPGDLQEKVDPYLRPLYDALYDMLPAENVIKYMKTGEIEIAPLAFMRGRTLSNAFVILDEAQNATSAQVKMFLTRLGEGTRMAITGDLSQTDLPRGMRSGLRDAIEKLDEIKEIEIVKFDDSDSVRHPLTTKIIQAYKKHEDEEKWQAKKQ